MKCFNCVPLDQSPTHQISTPAVIPGVALTLRPHQQYAIQWIRQLEAQPDLRGGLIADEMGLGKSLQMIGWLIMEYQMMMRSDRNTIAKQTLIICPGSLVENWKGELMNCLIGNMNSQSDLIPPIALIHGYQSGQLRIEWLVEPSIMTIDGSEVSEPKLSMAQILITSYGTLAADFKRFQTDSAISDHVTYQNSLISHNWHRVVLDESHHIRNRTSLTCRACCQLEAKYRWAMSGTPVQNHPLIDLYPLLKFLRLYPFCDWLHYKRHIVQPLTQNKAASGVVKRKLDIILSKICLRRDRRSVFIQKDSIMSEPASIERFVVDCQSSVSVTEKYMCSLFRNRLGSTSDRSYSLVNLLRLRQLANHPFLVFQSVLSQVATSPGQLLTPAKRKKFLHQSESFDIQIGDESFDTANSECLLKYLDDIDRKDTPWSILKWLMGAYSVLGNSERFTGTRNKEQIEMDGISLFQLLPSNCNSWNNKRLRDWFRFKRMFINCSGAHGSHKLILPTLDFIHENSHLFHSNILLKSSGQIDSKFERFFGDYCSDDYLEFDCDCGMFGNLMSIQTTGRENYAKINSNEPLVECDICKTWSHWKCMNLKKLNQACEKFIDSRVEQRKDIENHDNSSINELPWKHRSFWILDDRLKQYPLKRQRFRYDQEHMLESDGLRYICCVCERKRRLQKMPNDEVSQLKLTKEFLETQKFQILNQKNPFVTSSKLNKLLDLVKGKLSQSHDSNSSTFQAPKKLIVFSQFSKVFDIIEPILWQQMPLSTLIVRFDGTSGINGHSGSQGTFHHPVALFNRHKAVDFPNTEPSETTEAILLTTLKSGAEGLSIPTADGIVFLDEWWNAAVESQALARCLRWASNEQYQRKQNIRVWRMRSGSEETNLQENNNCLNLNGSIFETQCAIDDPKTPTKSHKITESKSPLDEISSGSTYDQWLTKKQSVDWLIGAVKSRKQSAIDWAFGQSTG